MGLFDNWSFDNAYNGAQNFNKQVSINAGDYKIGPAGWQNDTTGEGAGPATGNAKGWLTLDPGNVFGGGNKPNVGDQPQAPSSNLNDYAGRDTSAFWNALNTKVANQTSQGMQDSNAKMVGAGNYGADANAAAGRIQNQAAQDLAQGASQASDMNYQAQMANASLAQQDYANKLSKYNADNNQKTFTQKLFAGGGGF